MCRPGYFYRTKRNYNKAMPQTILRHERVIFVQTPEEAFEYIKKTTYSK